MDWATIVLSLVMSATEKVLEYCYHFQGFRVICEHLLDMFNESERERSLHTFGLGGSVVGVLPSSLCSALCLGSVGIMVSPEPVIGPTGNSDS